MNDLAGKAWAEVADLVDLQLSPLGLRAIEALAPLPGDSVLDVGCGGGQTVAQLADRVGPNGRVTGVDIAPPLLEIARRRTEGRQQVDFVEGDAAKLTFPEGSFDGVFSRFGVMAFGDPVAAFSNFRRMMKPSGRLAFVCWRALAENELDLLPLRATGFEGRFDPTPFSFADPDIIRTTLQAAGFHRIAIQPRDEMVSSGTLEDMVTVLLKVGPLGRIVRENPHLGPAAEDRLRAALEARGTESAVALNAATWIVAARAGLAAPTAGC